MEPRTPVKKRAYSELDHNAVVTPPSSVLKRLSSNSRLGASRCSSGAPLKPSQLMMSPNNENVEGPSIEITTNTLRNPFIVADQQPLEQLTPANSPDRLSFGKDSLYSRTKALLQRSAKLQIKPHGVLKTREAQHHKINSFLNKSIEEHRSDSLYVTGPPGTGKTAQLDSIIKTTFHSISLSQESPYSAPNDLVDVSFYETQNTKRWEPVVVSSINCIAIRDPRTIFNRIYSSICRAPHIKPVKDMDGLRDYMEKFSQELTFVIILDELDKLVQASFNDTVATKTLFELFMMAKLPTIRFVLIGISNSLNLTDRFLSRMSLKQELIPHTVIFQPYTSEQMYDIVMDRVQIATNDDSTCGISSVTTESIFNPMAVRFAAKRCSGSNGDLRRLFDILRSSIEILELERMSRSRISTIENDPKTQKVSLQHVSKAFGKVMSNTSTKSRISKLSLQQRIVLCALVHRQQTDIFMAHCNLEEAHAYYYKFTKSREPSAIPLNRSEFNEICSALESHGLISIFNNKSGRKTKSSVKCIKTSVDSSEFQEEIGKMDILQKYL